MAAGGSNELTIEATDSAGNRVLTYDGEKTLPFSGLSDALSGTEPTIEGSDTMVATVTFASGVTNGTSTTLVAYKAETTTVHVTDGNITSDTGDGYGLALTVNPAAASELYYITKPGTTTAGNSSTWSVQRRDPYRNLVLAGDLTVNLASNSTGLNKAFRLTPEGAGVESLTISNGTSGKGFYYYDEKAGDWTITAASDGLDSASHVVTINPGAVAKLAYTAHPAGSIEAGEETTAFTVRRQDTYGNDITTGGALVVNLASASDGGAKEFRAASGGESVTTVTIADATSGVNFYYYDENAGTWNITASSDGLISAVHALTVTPGTASYLNVTGSNAIMTAGTTQELTITAHDQYHNIATGYDGNRSLTFPGLWPQTAAIHPPSKERTSAPLLP
jgi:hypothetical protein